MIQWFCSKVCTKRIVLHKICFPRYVLRTSTDIRYLASALNEETSQIEPKLELDYFRDTRSDYVKVELNLPRSTLITGLIITGNLYTPTKVQNVQVFTSAEGSRGNLKLLRGTVQATNTTHEETSVFSMTADNEPIYIAINNPVGARMVRLTSTTGFRPFRFELIGLELRDWCNVPLNLNAKDFILTVSSIKSDLPFYDTTQLPIGSTLTQTGEQSNLEDKGLLHRHYGS